MRSRSGRPDGAPSSPSFGRRWRPRRRPFLSLLRPAWRPRRRHGGPGGGGGSGARCGALFLLSQINGGSCPSHTRTLADPRRRWRAAGDGYSSAHGGEQRRGPSGADPRRGGANPPRRHGSTEGRPQPAATSRIHGGASSPSHPIDGGADPVGVAPTPALPLPPAVRRVGAAADPIDGGGSTAAAGSRFSAARIQARVGFFSFFLFFLNDLPRRAFLCGRRGKSINRGGQSCPPREATIYRGLSTAADRFARRGKRKTPDTDKYSVVVFLTKL